MLVYNNAWEKSCESAGKTMYLIKRYFVGPNYQALKPCWTLHSFAGQNMCRGWMQIDCPNSCSMQTSRRRKRKRYKDTLKSTLKACNIPLNKWQELAQDRPAWRTAARKGLKLFEQDTLKSTLKACNIPLNKWQELAQDRPAWRTAARKGLKLFEQDRLQKLCAKRLARKNRVPDPSTAESHVHPPLGYKPTCTFINTDESSSDTKDNYYY